MDSRQTSHDQKLPHSCAPPLDPLPHLIPGNLTPDALDILTELSEMVIRLHQKSTSESDATTKPNDTPQQQQNQQQQQDKNNSHANGNKICAATATTPVTFNWANDIPKQTDRVKHKLQRARAALGTLPDVGRTVAEQEAEIEALGWRRRWQVGRLRRLRNE